MRYIEPEMELIVFNAEVRTDTITDSTGVGETPWIPQTSSVDEIDI